MEDPRDPKLRKTWVFARTAGNSKRWELCRNWGGVLESFESSATSAATVNSIIAPKKAQDFGVGKAFACERVLECVFVGVCVCGLERESEAEAEKTMLLGRSHRLFPVLFKWFAFFFFAVKVFKNGDGYLKVL